jgi:type I restriction enzyme S subunit
MSRTSREIEAENVRSRLQEGDIVYAIRGSIGAAEIIPAKLNGANLTQDAARIAARSGVHVRWLLYTVRSVPFFVKLEAGALGATIRGINIRDLKRADLPCPEREEQARIADFLDRQTGHFDSLIQRVTDGIARLREYRTALISAAVTGQIDVRGEVTP